MVLPPRHDRAARPGRRAGSAAGRRAILLAGRVAPAVLLIALYAWATTRGPTSDTRVNDLFVYSQLNGALDAGARPYRDFVFEYPPGALVPLRLPWLIGGARHFETWLAIEMAAGLLAVQAAVAALGGRRAAWWFALAPVLVGAQLRTHFDVVPAALTVGALALLARGRHAWGFAGLGLGGLVKLFPGLLVPVWALHLLRRRRPTAALAGTAVAAAVVLAGAAPFAASHGLDDMARFHLDRPVQLESTPAMVALAVSDPVVTGTTATPDRFKSNGVDGGATDAVAAVFLALEVATLLAIWVLAARGADPLDASLGALLAFVALGKVLSPQYVIWLAPFAALALARGAWALGLLLASACAVTQLWFPKRYLDLVGLDPAAVRLVALRDVLLLAALAVVLAALVSGRSTLAAPARSRPRAAGAPARGR